MTAQPFHLMAALLGGAALAGVHLFVLQRSVRILVSGREPGLRLLIEPIARILMVCTGIWVLGRGDGSAMLAALLGFVAGRTIVLAWVRRRAPARPPALGPSGSSQAES